MSALPKPSIYSYSTPSKHYSSKQKNLKSKTKQSQSKDSVSAQKGDRSMVRKTETLENYGKTKLPQTSKFPQVQHLPVKLKVLVLLQKSSLGLAFVLIASSIAVYISTVRIPELWSKKYQDLATLQRQERELVATNESLKHKLTQQAQQEDTNLPLIKANNAIFIPPVPLSQVKEAYHPQKLRVYSQDIPMGY